MQTETLAAWLEQRLTSERARREWRALWAAGIEQVLQRPCGELFSAAGFEEGLNATLTRERLAGFTRLGFGIGVNPWVEELERDQAPVGRFLSDGERGRLERLVSGNVDPGWVDVVFSQKATEALFADALFRALSDFSETVPQVLQSVTPSAFGRIASKLGEATGTMRGRMRDEFRRRLEPEIRRFVEAGTRRVLDGTARFVKSGMDKQVSQEARKNLLRYGLERSTATYARGLDDAARKDIEAIFVALAERPEAFDELRVRLRNAHRGFLERWSDSTLAELLRVHDASELADLHEAWAEASWPAVAAGLASETGRSYLLNLSAEILEVMEITPDEG